MVGITMGKVTYSPGIEYVKGSLAKPKKVDGHNHGDYLIATHREAPTTSNSCTRLYVRKGDTYGNNVSQTEDSINARLRFAAVSAAVKARRKDLSHMAQDLQAFNAQKDSPTGKKTMTAYLWKVCGQAYDQAQG